MRVTVIGASGGIGREFVRQAIEADHEVTAVIRDSARGGAAVREWERVPVGGPGRLQVAVVDTLSPGELLGAVSGRDAVVSALGPQGRSGDHTVNSRGVRAAVMAMQEAAVTRIVAVSAAPLFTDGSLLFRAVLRRVAWALFGAHYADLERMETVLRESGLDWTTVRPERLTDGAGTGEPVLGVDRLVPGLSITRADVATAILRLLPDAGSVGHPVGVGRP
jgi:putative NADH-flavin reductase